MAQVVVVLVVIGPLVVTSKRLNNWLKRLCVKSSIGLSQKADWLELKDSETGSKDLRLLGATCSLRIYQNQIPTKPRQTQL